MDHRTKYSAEEKLKIVEDCLHEKPYDILLSA